MAAENNTIMKNDVARVRMVDFNYQFTGNLNKFMEILGVTRKIAVQEGAVLKALKVTGTLESGAVAEGELIPLSHYATEEVPMGEAVLGKWRKATTAEAILKGGYEQAVSATTDKLVKDVQKKIRGDLFTFMAKGTGEASGDKLQSALANGWGKLQVLFEDDAVETVYFLNPTDVSDYLGTAQITMQTAFGLNYVENFLGLGTVILSANVPAGKQLIVCTAVMHWQPQRKTSSLITSTLLRAILLILSILQLMRRVILASMSMLTTTTLV